MGRARDARQRPRCRGVRRRSTRTAARARSASTPARRGRSTSRGRSTRPAASPTGRRRRRRFPSSTAPSSSASSTAATSARTSARGTAASRSGGRASGRRTVRSRPSRSLDWLEADGEELVARYDRLYVPRNDPRWLRRNALVAAGNVGGDSEREAVATLRERRRRASARARPRGRSPGSTSGANREADPEPRLRPRRARAAGGDQGRARPRRLPVAGLRAGRLGAWSASMPCSRCCSSGSSYRWRGRLRYLAMLSVVTDFAITTALMFVFAWEPAQPLRSLQFLVVLEAALFFRLAGGLIAGAVTFPILLVLDLWREAQFDIPVRYDALVLRVVVAMALGAVVGRLVDMERGQAHDAEERAAEAERLRDELGRRVDLLEATSRAARALGSSLDLERAFAAFVRELRSLLPFDRAAILLAEARRCPCDGDRGHRRPGLSEPGTAITVPGEILEAVIEEGRTIYREDIAEHPHRGGSRAARARHPRAGARAAAARNALDRCARDRAHRAGVVPGRGGRAGDVPRAARRDGGAEPAHLRGRARDGRRAAAAVLAPRRLRLARLARAAQPDGGGDRLRPHAPGPLARAQAGAARGVPRRDRRRDDPPGGARRRRARHLADRGRHLRLPLRRRRPGGGLARLGRGRRDRSGRGAADGGARRLPCRRCAATRSGCGSSSTT